jgi:serine/threonine protein kinase
MRLEQRRVGCLRCLRVSPALGVERVHGRRHAFHATNLPALVMTIVQAQYKPVPEHYPEGLRRLIHRCLSKEPADRPSIKAILSEAYVVKWVATMRMRNQHQGGMEHAGEFERRRNAKFRFPAVRLES